MISFKDGFKRARKRTGLTQEKFAKKYNFSLASVKKWEQGKAVPEFDTLVSLCEIFQCDMSYLANQIDLPTHDMQFIHQATNLSEAAINRIILETKILLDYETDIEITERKRKTINFILTSNSFWEIVELLGGYLGCSADTQSIGAYYAQTFNLIYHQTTTACMAKDIIGYRLQKKFFDLLNEVEQGEEEHG